MLADGSVVVGGSVVSDWLGSGVLADGSVVSVWLGSGVDSDGSVVAADELEAGVVSGSVLLAVGAVVSD